MTFLRGECSKLLFYAGIIHGRVLKGELYTHRAQKAIYLHLGIYLQIYFMKIFLASIVRRNIEISTFNTLPLMNRIS